MKQLTSSELEFAKNQLQEIVKPFQREQNQRQKKSDFLKKCIRCVEKNDFFQLDELLKSKLSRDILEDPCFEECRPIFYELQQYSDHQINQYRVEFKGALLERAHECELPLEVDIPQFSVLKGIDGKLDFVNKSTNINQITIKSIDPKRIVSQALKLKRKLYDTTFEPKNFIDSLFQCYKESLIKMGQEVGHVIPIRQLYNDYVWSLQSKTFFQNMDKVKFKGYTIDQFAVDLWRFFQSDVSSAEGGYLIRLNSGRGKSLWLIDQSGEKRQITTAAFIKTQDHDNENTRRY